jgi:Ca2+-transporting ATPase
MRRSTPASRVAEVPFSSERKLMSTVHTDAEQQERLLALTKGAPDVLLARCSQELVGEAIRPLAAKRRAEISQHNEELAGEALRTLGVAFRILPKDAFRREEIDARVEQDLVFLGLIGMIDPPRDEAKDAVMRAKGYGHCRSARHRGRRASGHGRGAREDARRDAHPDGS